MPDMDGFETASMIRQRALSEHTPIIFITAFDKADAQMARGYSLGAVDYIFSPIVPEVVRAKVSVFVELFAKTQEVKDHLERLRWFEEWEHRRRLAPKPKPGGVRQRRASPLSSRSQPTPSLDASDRWG